MFRSNLLKTMKKHVQESKFVNVIFDYSKKTNRRAFLGEERDLELHSVGEGISQEDKEILLYMTPHERFFIRDDKRYFLSHVPYIGKFMFKGRECEAVIDEKGKYCLMCGDEMLIEKDFSSADKHVFSIR